MRPLVLLLTLLVLLTTAAVLAQDATPEATPGDLQAGDTRLDDMGIEQVYVPSGCFLMGTSEEQAAALEPPEWAARQLASEQPQYEVCLTGGYWIDQYEVTNAAFQAFVDDGGYENEAYWSQVGLSWLNRQDVAALPEQCVEDAAPDQPRVCITWFEAQAYANWRGGRLPTEAE